jgi:hypothetical protein
MQRDVEAIDIFRQYRTCYERKPLVERLLIAKPKDNSQGFPQNPEVKLQGTFFGVLDIKSYHFIKGEAIFATDLPQSRDAWRHFKAAALPRFIVFPLQDIGTRTDDRHIAPKYVEELRQFV